MRAVQISELTGPQGLKLVDVPGAGGRASAGRRRPGRGDRRRGRGGVVPGGPAEPRRVPAQAGPAVHPGRRGRRHGPQRAGGEPAPAGRPGRGDVHARRVRGGRRRARVPDLPAGRRARRGPGRRADPQLPHGLLLAGHARPAAGGRDRARPRRRGRRRHRDAAGRQGPWRAYVRGRLRRREGGGRAPRRRRRGLPLRRAVEGRGARGRPRRPGHRPGRRRPHDRLAAVAEGGGAARGGRLHRRLDPRGQGQPPAAQQRVGGRRRLGRLRALQARAQRRDPGQDRRARSRPATCGRSSAPACRSSARPRRSS